MNRRYLNGQQFGKLNVIGELSERKSGNVQWLCKCDCGNQTVVITASLLRGITKSCGCIQKEKASERAMTGNNHKTHGMNRTKIYYVWQSMKNRCLNSNCKKFCDYGGRGIAICDEWKNSFQSFYDYVSKLPHYADEGYSIDRINNDGNYEPGNVKWSTRYEQTHNRRKPKRRRKNAVKN